MTDHDLRRFPDEPNTRPDVPRLTTAKDVHDAALLRWIDSWVSLRGIRMIWVPRDAGGELYYRAIECAESPPPIKADSLIEAFERVRERESG